MTENFDPYYKWLGIDPDDQPPDHYRLLGIRAFQSDPDVIENAADQRMAHVRSFQAGRHAAISQKILNEIAAARVCLLNPAKKTAYDAELRAKLQALGAASDAATQGNGPTIAPLDIPIPDYTTATFVPPRDRARESRPAWQIPAAIVAASVFLVAIVALLVSGRTKPTIEPVAKHPSEIKDPSPVAPAPTVTPNQPSPQKAPSRKRPAVVPAQSQLATAKQLRVPVEITNSIGMQMVLIPPGEFLAGKNGPGVRRRVRITKPFFLGQCTVTVGEFRQFVEATGHKTDPEKDGKGGDAAGKTDSWVTSRDYVWHKPPYPQTDEHPVVLVSWNDARSFCEWLSSKEGAKYRMPTEAEWEHAARAGTSSDYYWGDDREQYPEYGNVADAAYKAKFPAVQGTFSGSDGHVYPAPVGSFKPNAFGLYDMLGNVTQLCSDWFSPSPYSGPMPLEDPIGPLSGDRHVLRGVGFNNTVDQGSLAARWRFWPTLAMTAAGFRICRELGEGSPPPNSSEAAGPVNVDSLRREARARRSSGDGLFR